MPAWILIVDDDPEQRQRLQAAAMTLGHECVSVADGRAALDRLAGPDGDRFCLMILDLVMPELDGMGVLERLPDLGRLLPVIVQSAENGGVADALRAGACDFLVKPASRERIEVAIANALRLGALEGELSRIKRSAAGTLGFRDLIGAGSAMQRVLRLGERAAASTLPILIEGESGVGKERIARAIHGSSDRRAKPFVTIPCGAPLAGTETHAGTIRQAQGGTLFLDDIDELPLDAQGRLLSTLQDGAFEPVGGKRPVRVDFRLIAATKRDLIACVKEGRFREDLYYRLNVSPIRVPPLRQRREDIPDLAHRFAMRFAAEEGKNGCTTLSAETLALLGRHNWPGNVRQLENAIFRAVMLAEGPELTPDDFPRIKAEIDGVRDGAKFAPAPDLSDIIVLPSPIPTVRSERPPTPDRTAVRVLQPDGDFRPLCEIEADTIRLAVRHYRGRMATVARKLRIGRSTLYRKLQELGIAESDPSLAAE